MIPEKKKRDCTNEMCMRWVGGHCACSVCVLEHPEAYKSPSDIATRNVMAEKERYRMQMVNESPRAMRTYTESQIRLRSTMKVYYGYLLGDMRHKGERYTIYYCEQTKRSEKYEAMCADNELKVVAWSK